jgi:simple sugar transport system permease protein
VNVDVEVEAREDTPQWLVYGTPVFTVVAALAVSAIGLVALGVNPLAAYWTMFVGTLTSTFGLTETMIKAVPLILTGLAVYLPLKAGLWNIGAEGQLFLGAIAGTFVGLNLSAPAVLLVPAMFIGAGIAGAFWAGVPAWLRAKWGVNEIITTLLLTFVAGELRNYLVRGPMQGGTGNFPQSSRLSAAAQFPNVPLTGVHIGILVAVAMVALTYLLMNRTGLGFEITFVGANDEAAVQAGMDKTRVYLFVFLAGGLFAAFGGIAEIAGVQNRLRAGFSPGYGFTAIPIALLGRNGAFKVMLAGVFFALLFVGGSSMEVSFGVPAALVDVIQALIILFLITAEFFKSYRLSIDVERDPGRAPAGGRPEGEV